MRNEEEIVEIERKRIARDLHDTVSQELFAANMILSGVAAQTLELEKSQIHPFYQTFSFQFCRTKM